MSQTTTRIDATDTRTRPTAHRLVVRASVVALVADLAIMGVVGEVIPPLLVFAVLTGAAVVLASRRPRTGLIVLGVLALFANGGGLPFLLADLAAPTDPVAFVYAVLSGGGRLVAMIAVVLALRASDDAARRLAVASLAILGVAVVGSLAARASVSSDPQQAGDVEVVAAGFAFPELVAVPADGTLHLDNQDPVRHTFAVEGTAVDVLLEPGVQRRFSVDLAPGTYTFVCTVPGHEAMTGTLEVE